MNEPIDLLKANLRRAGYPEIARNLRRKIHDAGGFPCLIEEGKDRVQLLGGGVQLHAIDLHADELIATETWHAAKRRRRRPGPAPEYEGGPMASVSIRFPVRLRRKLERLRKGETFGAAVRDIVERYVQAAER